MKAYLLDEKSKVVQLALNALQKYDVKPKIEIVRYATDAASFNEHVLPQLCWELVTEIIIHVRNM